DYFYILLAWAIWRCPPDPRERDRLVTILMATGSFAGAFGLAQQALGFARLHALGYQYNSTIRFTGSHLRSFGTFSYQSPFAYFLMVVLILGVSQALTEPHRARNRLFVASLPVLLGSLLFTFERGAWLGVGVGWLYIGLRRHRTLLLALPPALLVPLYLPAGITSTALSNRSLGQRANGWAANIHQVLLHPLGAGIGATGAAAARVAALQVQGSAPPSGTSGTVVAATYQPDNYYYKTLYEFGVVGMWLLVIFLVAAAVSCHQTSGRLQGRDAALADGVCAFVLAAVVASAVATFFEIYPMDLFTWLLLGTVAVCDPE
ncbi:MAG: O-antigen ligase family protein, partial [Acidimicrobiales bacterium]